MWDLLYAFGIGLSLVAGIIVGLMIARLTLKAQMKENSVWKEHHLRVEDRLEKYVENTGAIAYSLEVIAIGLKNKD